MPFTVSLFNFTVLLRPHCSKALQCNYNFQDSLRYLVQDSLVNFTQMILDACHATLKCTEDLDWGKDLMVSCFKPKRNPLFFIDLLIDNQGVHYSTNLNSYESVLIGLFDKGIQSTQNVPQLEKVNGDL